MYATKVEIGLKKAEPGSWPRLEIPRTTPIVNNEPKENEKADDNISAMVESVDLCDL